MRELKIEAIGKPRYKRVLKSAVEVIKPGIPYPWKKYAIEKTVQFRISRGQATALPNFVIIGAQRSGSTSLYRYLIDHPSISPALHKEIHFFDKKYERGLDWYRGHFDSAEYLRTYNLITGEASPYYILNPTAAQRIATTIPNVKIIVLLRNPINRAFSHYHKQIQWGHETRTFEEAIRSEMRAFAQHNGNGYNAFLKSYDSVPYLARCVYHEQLVVWFDLFPKEQMLILRSEDFYADASNTYQKVLQFLGVPKWELKKYPVHQRMRYEPMSPDTRRSLVDFFAPHNERLFALLGRELKWEKRATTRPEDNRIAGEYL